MTTKKGIREAAVIRSETADKLMELITSLVDDNLEAVEDEERLWREGCERILGECEPPEREALKEFLLWFERDETKDN